MSPASFHPVDALYRQRNYPEMSHPVADPAVCAVAALLGGLRTPHPATARILEIGCGSGHHLTPLAQRWPQGAFTGVDISENAIALAKSRAAECELANITFLVADLRTFQPDGGKFDYIIAHGFFSWVADDVKSALLKFCASYLSPSGVVIISLNIWAGWEERLPVIAAARKICIDLNCDEMTALASLRDTTKDGHWQWMLEDMLGKGPDILAFDDFAPVMDALPYDAFVNACARAGLRWLGESDPAENIPSSLDDTARASLLPLRNEPLKMQMAADALVGTAFRSAIFCKSDAPVAPSTAASLLLKMSVSLGEERLFSQGLEMQNFREALTAFHPCCVPVSEVWERMGNKDISLQADLILQEISRGGLRARIEPVCFAATGISLYKLNAFRLLCARSQLPIVDAWHVSSVFPADQYELLGLLDGTKSTSELEAFAYTICPELNFHGWLGQLAQCGMFA